MKDFSNYDKDVFIVKLDRMIDRGALLSRYSRTSNLDIRDVYRKKFSENQRRGEDFYKRVFVEYGDESVAELVTAQLAVQNVSNVVSKTMEELRVGLSFLEKSSRYVRYDKKVSGRYLFLEPEKAGITGPVAGDYEAYCQNLFDFYSANYESVQQYFRQKFPMDSIVFDDVTTGGEAIPENDSEKGILEKAYNSAVRARALDDLRFLLPASTLTNVGISGNGRSLIHLVQKLKSSGLPEAVNVTEALNAQLQPELPELIKSALSNHGRVLIDYDYALASVQKSDLSLGQPDVPGVELIEHEDRRNALVKSLSIYDFSVRHMDLHSAYLHNKGRSDKQLLEDILALSSLRKNRRHKLHRSFESVSYLFQITTNYGAFRDLQRHRFISLDRRPLSPGYGFDTPEVFAGSRDYAELMKQGTDIWKSIFSRKDVGIAQYVLPYAFRYPVTAYLSLRELAFFCELRSTPQAHPDLRRIAMQMYDQVKGVHPELSELLRFVDTSEYALGRLRAERSKEKKLSKMSHGD